MTPSQKPYRQLAAGIGIAAIALMGLVSACGQDNKPQPPSQSPIPTEKQLNPTNGNSFSPGTIATTTTSWANNNNTKVPPPPPPQKAPGGAPGQHGGPGGGPPGH